MASDEAARVVTRAVRRVAAQRQARLIVQSLRTLRFIDSTVSEVQRKVAVSNLRKQSGNPDSSAGLSPAAAANRKAVLTFQDQLEKAILKVDEVPTYGSLFVRARRKEVVEHAQAVLKGLDLKVAPM